MYPWCKTLSISDFFTNKIEICNHNIYHFIQCLARQPNIVHGELDMVIYFCYLFQPLVIYKSCHLQKISSFKIFFLYHKEFFPNSCNYSSHFLHNLLQVILEQKLLQFLPLEQNLKIWCITNHSLPTLGYTFTFRSQSRFKDKYQYMQWWPLISLQY